MPGEEVEVGHMTMINGAIVETVINTLKTLQIEVPGSVGAKRVMLYEAKATPDVPGTVASTMTTSYGIILVGYKTPATATLQEEDAVVSRYIGKYSDATPEPVLIFANGSGELGSPVQVPVHGSTGKFYVTVAVQGAANAAGTFMHLFYHMRFVVYR
jgi:hypothetical protein